MLAGASRPEEKKLLVSALGGVPCVEALRAALSLVDVPSLSDEAGLASLRVAAVIWRAYQPEAEEAARRLEGSANLSVRERATALLFKLSKADNLALGASAASLDGYHPDGQGGGPDAAIDGNPDTYWDEEDGKPLYILQVRLAAPAAVSVLRILGYQQHAYAPKDLDILCDGKPAKHVADAQYPDNWLTVSFPPVQCTTVELRITGYYGQSPAIRELEIYSRVPGRGSKP